jgi:hypothetical protein
MTLIILTTSAYAADTSAPDGKVVPQASAPIKKAIPALAKPDAAKALAVAEKYYKLGVSKATAHEKNYLPTIITWKPDFKGKTKNSAQAAKYLTSSAYLTAFTDLKGIYLPLNAAIFALDAGNATIAGNLASAIAAYSEDTVKKPLGTVLAGNKEAKTCADDAAAVYEYALALKLAQPSIDASALTLLLNYGYLNIDRGKPDAAKVVLEAAYKLAPGYMPAIEGMAAYWLAKGDKTKAKKLLEGATTSVMARNIKKAKENVSDQKVPQIKPGDSIAAAESKLKTMDKVQTVLASDFYEQLDPQGAQAARRFVNGLQSGIRFTAPDYKYLSQYSTLKNYRSQGGNSAFEAFDAELTAMEERVASRETGKEAQMDALEKEMEAIESDPNRDPDHLAARYAQLALATSFVPESAILALNPESYANPTDIIAQQYNVIELRHKWGNYEAYFFMLIDELNDVIEPAGDNFERKMAPLREAMGKELDELYREHEASHEPSGGQCDACIVKTHAIHSTYDPQMNQIAETTWMDATNFVSMRYTQRIKPMLEAMYRECMENILLISDPSVRATVEKNLKENMEELVVATFSRIRRAYTVDVGSYPYECDCSLEEIDAALERQRKAKEAAEAQKIPMQQRARQAFMEGDIPENSKLYQQLDKYSASYQLMFTKIKMHPLKTSMTLEVTIPTIKTGASASITQNHIRDTTDYSGKITVDLKGGDDDDGKNNGSRTESDDYNDAKTKMKGKAIGGSVSVALGGEMTVDGKGNVVSADIAGSITGTISTVGLEATGTYEASVMRGCKLSGQVTQTLRQQLFETPEEVGAFRPYEENSKKKVLWQGEYQVSQ